MATGAVWPAAPSVTFFLVCVVPPPPPSLPSQFSADNGLTRSIISNTRRYVELFSEVLDELLKERTPADHAIRSEEIADVLLSHRLQRIAANAEVREGGEAAADEIPLPTRLIRRCVLPLWLCAPVYERPRCTDADSRCGLTPSRWM